MIRSKSVYLQRCSSYDSENLKRFFERCFGQHLSESLRSSRVLIKPNLISAKKSGPATTDSLFLIALADYFSDRGAVVAVGDSPAFGSARSVLQGIGVLRDLESRGIDICEFSRVRKKKLQCGVEVGVAAEIYQYDYFINAPKIKAHNQMYVTLAVKNIFGIVKGLRKSMLHMEYGGPDNLFSRIILDLIDILPPNFSCVDGITAMHRSGPITGDPIDLGCLAFSQDPVAIDTALLNALELQCEKSLLWREASKRNHPGGAIGNIEFPLLSPEDFHGSNFKPPLELSPIRFNPFRFIWGNIKRAGLQISGK